MVKDLGGKNHQMTVLNLLNSIEEKDSYKKVSKRGDRQRDYKKQDNNWKHLRFVTFFSLQQIKTDMVLIMCKKQTSQKWECLTKVEKQAKEKE